MVETALAMEMGDGNEESNPLARSLLMAGLGFGLTLLAGFVGFLANKVWGSEVIIGQHDVTIHQLADIAVRIDRHLESIDSKYQDLTIIVQTVKGEQSTEAMSISRVREDLEQGRADRIREIADLTQRVGDMEKLLAPLRDGHLR